MLPFLLDDLDAAMPDRRNMRKGLREENCCLPAISSLSHAHEEPNIHTGYVEARRKRFSWGHNGEPNRRSGEFVRSFDSRERFLIASPLNNRKSEVYFIAATCFPYSQGSPTTSPTPFLVIVHSVHRRLL